MKIQAFCDSLCEPNPGDMHVGYWAKDANDNLLFAEHKKIGYGTCNEAEYHALFTIVAKLEEVLKGDLKSHSITIHSDSQLMTKQMNGLWQVTKPEIAMLYGRGKRLQEAHGFNVQWVPRENNSVADALAQEERLKGSGRRYQLEDGRYRVHRNTPCVEVFSDREMGKLLHSSKMSLLKEELEGELESAKLNFRAITTTLTGIRQESMRIKHSLPKLNSLVEDWLTSTFTYLDSHLVEFIGQANVSSDDLRISVKEFFNFSEFRPEMAHEGNEVEEMFAEETWKH